MAETQEVEGVVNPAPVVEEAGNGAWTEKLPQSVKDWEEAKTAKDEDSFWQQIADHRSMLGRSIRIPSSDAGNEARQKFYDKIKEVEGVVQIPGQEDQEGWDSFYTKMGRPNEAGQYKLADGVGEDFRQLAHAVGLSQTQANRFSEQLNAKTQGEIDAREQKAGEEFAALQKDMGPALERKMENVGKFLNQFDSGGEIQERLKDPTQPGTAGLIRMMIKASDVFMEGQSVDGDGGNSFTVTPGEARERIAEIRGNKDDVFHKPGHPGHEDRKLYMNRMYAIGHPGEQEASG